MKVKICGMRDPANIREVAALQPDYMGFIFYKGSQRCILSADASTPLQELHSSIEQIPSSVTKVGVFVNEPLKNVIRFATEYGMDMVQLHGDEPPEYCEDLRLLDFRIIKAFGVHDAFDFWTLADFKDLCDYFLFDTRSSSYGGTGRKFNWELLKQYDNSKPVFLSGGLTADDIPTIHDLLNDVNIHALDFNSKLEVAPGMKDIEKCRQAIEITRNIPGQ